MAMNDAARTEDLVIDLASRLGRAVAVIETLLEDYPHGIVRRRAEAFLTEEKQEPVE